jgi:hypothetical protein
MNRDDLEALREGWDFEVKLGLGRDGLGALPDSLWETYSAMANTNGGVILVGAAERPDGSLDLRGIPDLDKVERELWNAVQNPQKVSANLLGRDHVERIEIDGRAMLLVRVPKATRAQRPTNPGSGRRFCAYTRATVSPIATSHGGCSPMHSPSGTRRSWRATEKLISTPKASGAIGRSSRSDARTTRSSARRTQGSCGRLGLSGETARATSKG